MLETYPKDVLGNLRYRTELFLACRENPDLQAVVRAMVRKDQLFFVNVFCWAWDDGPPVEDRPIVTYEYQDRALLEIDRCIEKGENLFIDKSRDMLATYMVLMTFLWRWMAKPSESFKLGSWKEEYVDKPGVMGTLFEKLRYNLRRMPYYVLPQGFSVNSGMPYMKLLNEELGGAISGEATNANFARSSRETAILMDEFQSWEEADEAWTAASDSTRCKIALGTPKGMGNRFAELKRTDEVKRKLHLHWSINPEKAQTSPEYLEKMKPELHSDQRGVPKFSEIEQKIAGMGCFIDKTGKLRSEWYDLEVLRRGGPASKDVRENLDCDYLSTGQPVFDTVKCQFNMRNSVPPKEIGNLVWKIGQSPLFDKSGNCVNQQELGVEWVPSYGGKWLIWDHPSAEKYENEYCLGADAAEGLEDGDYDSASVLRRVGDKPRTVACIHGHFQMHEYGEELVKGALYYKRAVLNIERNLHGYTVIQSALRIYSNLWHEQIFTKGFAEEKDNIGFRTSSGNVANSSKAVLIGSLQKAISFGEFEDPDEAFWEETLTFIEAERKLQASGKSKGRNQDDRVMNRAIMWFTHLNMPNPALRAPEIVLPRWQMRQSTNNVGWVLNA